MENPIKMEWFGGETPLFWGWYPFNESDNDWLVVDVGGLLFLDQSRYPLED